MAAPPALRNRGCGTLTIASSTVTRPVSTPQAAHSLRVLTPCLPPQTYINRTEPNGKPVFWGRGNGWAISAFAQALQQLPPAHPHAVEFRAKLVAMAAALKAIQGPDGLWRSSLADAAHYPNP